MSGSVEDPTGDPGRTLVIVDAGFPDAEVERAAAASHRVAVERRIVADPGEIRPRWGGCRPAGPVPPDRSGDHNACRGCA